MQNGKKNKELNNVFSFNIASGQIVDDLYTQLSHLLTSLDLVWLDPALFTDVINRLGAPLDQCWGFVDELHEQWLQEGTLFEISSI